MNLKIIYQQYKKMIYQMINIKNGYLKITYMVQQIYPRRKYKKVKI